VLTGPRPPLPRAGGPLEFLFVVESAADEAHAAVQQLMEELAAAEERGGEGQGQGRGRQQQQADRRWRLPSGRAVRLVQAGPCSSCSQKIHK
jgi:hypothetical protein